MKFRALAAAALLLTLASVGHGADPETQDVEVVLAGVDGSDLNKQLLERREKINHLSDQEKLLFSAASKKAMDDPDVKTALAARNKAAQEFQITLQESMLKSYPTLALIFEKMRSGAGGRP